MERRRRKTRKRVERYRGRRDTKRERQRVTWISKRVQWSAEYLVVVHTKAQTAAYKNLSSKYRRYNAGARRALGFGGLIAGKGDGNHCASSGGEQPQRGLQQQHSDTATRMTAEQYYTDSSKQQWPILQWQTQRYQQKRNGRCCKPSRGSPTTCRQNRDG